MVTMNIINFITRTVVLWLLLSFGMAMANAESSATLQLQERFPDSVKFQTDKRLSMEFCPDNTCDLFETKRSTSVEALSDFAFLYLYFFSDYFVLVDWRAEDAARNTASVLLKKYSADKCANSSALLHNPSGRPPANTDVSGLADCLDESEQGPLPHDQLVRVQP